ncbi:ATPase [Marinobacter zhejiangensis]|uniref:ATPase n=1 Tax=Marinobacter zhejiangensis TaxID=488535 RepID=A0A1I4SYK4_9GAMM|nr:ATPase [Marinobacter zhejiangensis]SFM69487.1 hypothetical protein SAMN04487963_3390 [Marinobacter zhejiangensis]
MEIKTFRELIDWTRDLHQHLSECLSHCAETHKQERAQMLLEYLAAHEAELAKVVAEFEHQGDGKAMDTRVYDYLNHQPLETHRSCSRPYAEMSFDEISREVFSFHDQIMDLYKTLVSKADIPEAQDLLQALLDMEQHEAMRLARQVGRMDDV